MKRALWLTLLGALLGLVAGALQPTRYQARTTLLFPGVNPQRVTQLMKTLAASPEGLELAAVSPAETSPDQAQLARVLFTSQAAAEYALSREQASAAPTAAQAQAIVSQIQIQAPDASTLTLSFQARNAVLARQTLNSLLEYYQQFVAKQPLTRVKKTRQRVEARLTKVRQNLTRLEDQLSRSQSKELRNLGYASLKVDPKVMHQIWLRRVDEEGKGRALLQKMQALRARQELPNADEKWLAEWAAGRKMGVRYAPDLLGRPTSQKDLLERARLERTYYEALLLHRSLTLQHSFLLTWEDLESPNFEILDPISVAPLRPRRWLFALAGAALGLLAWLLTGTKKNPRRGSADG